MDASEAVAQPAQPADLLRLNEIEGFIHLGSKRLAAGRKTIEVLVTE